MVRIAKIDDYTYEVTTRMGRGRVRLSVWGASCDCAEYRRNADKGILDCSHKLLYYWHGPVGGFDLFDQHNPPSGVAGVRCEACVEGVEHGSGGKDT